MKASDYVGTPYSNTGKTPKEGLDCFTLVVHARKELYGMDTPSALHKLTTKVGGLREIKRQQAMPEWKATKYPNPGDIVLMKTHPHKAWHHIGVLIEDDLVLHAIEPMTVITDKRTLARRYCEWKYMTWVQ